MSCYSCKYFDSTRGICSIADILSKKVLVDVIQLDKVSDLFSKEYTFEIDNLKHLKAIPIIATETLITFKIVDNNSEFYISINFGLLKEIHNYLKKQKVVPSLLNAIRVRLVKYYCSKLLKSRDELKSNYHI